MKISCPTTSCVRRSRIGWYRVWIRPAAMISSRPSARRSSSRVRWRRAMNMASSRARWIDRSARSMGSRYIKACPMSKVTGCSTPGPRWAGSASTIRSRSRRARPSIESASRGAPSPPRRKTRNLSLRTLMTATMSRGPRWPFSRSEASVRANPRSSSSKDCQPCTGSRWPSAPRSMYTRARVPRSSISRRTSSSTATSVGRPVLESMTWFLKRSHSARRRKYSSFGVEGAVIARGGARAPSTRRLSPLADLAEDGLDLA